MVSRVPGFSWPMSQATPRTNKVTGNSGAVGGDQAGNKPMTPAATPRGSAGQVASSGVANPRLATAEEDRAAGPCDSKAILENWVVSWADKMCQALSEAEAEASRPNSARASQPGSARGSYAVPPLSARSNRDTVQRRASDSFRIMQERGGRGGRGVQRKPSGRGHKPSHDSGGQRTSGSPRMPLPPDSLAAVAALNKLERALQPYLQGSMGFGALSNGIEAFLSPRYAARYSSAASTQAPTSRSVSDMRLGGAGSSHGSQPGRSSGQGQQSQLRSQQTKASPNSPGGPQAGRQPFVLRTSPVPPLSSLQREGDARRSAGNGPSSSSQGTRPSPLRQQPPGWPEQEGPEWRSIAGAGSRSGMASPSREVLSGRFKDAHGLRERGISDGAESGSSEPGSGGRRGPSAFSPEKAAIMGSPRSSLMPEVITRSSGLTVGSSPSSPSSGVVGRRGTGQLESLRESQPAEDEAYSARPPAPSPSLQASSPCLRGRFEALPLEADACRPPGMLDEQAMQWRLDRMHGIMLQVQRHTEEQQRLLRADFEELLRMQTSDGNRLGNCPDSSSSDESSSADEEPEVRLKNL